MTSGKDKNKDHLKAAGPVAVAVYFLIFMLTALASSATAANVSSVSATPNPFDNNSQSTTISYTLTGSSLLWLRIYDGSSVLKRKLVNPSSFTSTNRTSGAKNEVWDGKDDSSSLLPSGDYPYNIDDILYVSQSATATSNDLDDVVVDPTNDQVIWGSSRNDGRVYKSTNGGSSWSNSNYPGSGPKGMAISSDGQTIWVADRGDARVYRTTDGGSNWSNVSWSSVDRPYDVGVTSDGTVAYGVDRNLLKVYKYSSGSWSQTSGQPSGMVDLGGVAVHPTDSTIVYAADYSAQKVWKSTDSGASWAQFATQGTGTEQYNTPYDVEVDASGNVWITDMNYNRVQQYKSDGTWIMTLGGTGTGTGNYQFNAGTSDLGAHPVTISGETRLYVADYSNNRVKRYLYDNWSSSTDITIAADALAVGTATATVASATSLAVSMPYTGDDNNNSTYTVDYKLSSSGSWTNWVTAAANTASPYTTTITGLTTSTDYDVKMTYNDADTVSGTNPQTISSITVVESGNATNLSATPNPFNASASETTTISYDLASSALLWLRIYDGSNNLKRQLVNPSAFNTTNRTSGTKNEVWDGKDDSSSVLADGFYSYTIDDITYVSQSSTATSTGIDDVVVDPTNDQVMWASTRNDGRLDKSTNGGSSWSNSNFPGSGPKGLAITSDGQTIWVADRGDGRVYRTTDGGSNWSNVSWSSVDRPYDMAVTADGAVAYGVDLNLNKVYRYSSSSWSQTSAQPSGISAPSGVAVHPTDSTIVYVADDTARKVWKSTNSGGSWTQFASQGTTKDKYNTPYDVEVDASGNVWVTDMNYDRVQQYKSDGTWIMTLGGTSAGSGNYQFNAGSTALGAHPVTISGETRLYVADYSNDYVKRYLYDNRTAGTDIEIASNQANIGDGSNPSSVMVEPGTANQALDTFTVQTTNSNDTVTAVEVTTAGTTAVTKVYIKSNDGGTTYGSQTTPAGNVWSVSLSTNIDATTTLTSYKIYIDTDTHAGLASGSYAVTGTVTDITAGYVGTMADSASATVTVDNLATANVTGVSGLAGNTQAQISWTNPADGDFTEVVILRSTASISDAPAEGTTYSVDDTIGSSTVRYVGSSTSFIDTGLTNDTNYYYKIFPRDTYNNYASGVQTGPHMPYFDDTPPADVTSFSATSASTGNTLNLSWTNPGDGDLAGIKIVRATGGTAPSDCTDSAVYNGSGTSYSDTGLTDGQLYSYRACSYDVSSNYADGATASGTPADTAAPADITGLTATPANAEVALAWTNPVTSDFAGVKVLRKLSAPSSCTDGAATQIYSGTGTGYTDTELTNETTYYYLLCAFDEVPNYSSGVATSTIPSADGGAPDAVSDLQSTFNYTRAMKLGWTAPGDDGSVGTATSYDLRFVDAVDYPSNMSTYVDTNWGSSSQTSSEPTPQVAGSTESFTFSTDSGSIKMTPNTLYYTAIKTTDDMSNESDISNVLTVHSALKYGYNYVSLPYDVSSGGSNTVNNLLVDDVPYVYMFKWTPSGLDSGGRFTGRWTLVSSSSNISSAMTNASGYYMYAFAMNSSIMDEKNSSETVLVTENTDNWTKVDLSKGRNLVGNPYLKNVDFSNIKICRDSSFTTSGGCSGGTVTSFVQAVTNAWMDSTVAYYGNSTTFTSETCNDIECLTKLRPWWGQWVYLLDDAATYIMAIPKP